MPINTTPLAGINFAQAYTLSETVPEYPGRQFTPGTHVQGTDGSTWIFVMLEAASTCTVNDALIVTVNSTWEVKAVTNTLALSKLGQRMGIAGATGTAGQYLWMQTTGYEAAIAAATGSTAFTVLHTSATAGRLTTTAVASTSVIVSGGVLLATAAANVGAANLTGLVVGAND